MDIDRLHVARAKGGRSAQAVRRERVLERDVYASSMGAELAAGGSAGENELAPRRRRLEPCVTLMGLDVDRARLARELRGW